MTQDQPSIADAYKSIVDAEKQALALEAMLDQLDGKLDSLLEEIEAGEKERDSNGDLELRNAKMVEGEKRL